LYVIDFVVIVAGSGLRPRQEVSPLRGFGREGRHIPRLTPGANSISLLRSLEVCSAAREYAPQVASLFGSPTATWSFWAE